MINCNRWRFKACMNTQSLECLSYWQLIHASTLCHLYPKKVFISGPGPPLWNWIFIRNNMSYTVYGNKRVSDSNPGSPFIYWFSSKIKTKENKKKKMRRWDYSSNPIQLLTDVFIGYCWISKLQQSKLSSCRPVLLLLRIVSAVWLVHGPLDQAVQHLKVAKRRFRTISQLELLYYRTEWSL